MATAPPAARSTGAIKDRIFIGSAFLVVEQFGVNLLVAEGMSRRQRLARLCALPAQRAIGKLLRIVLTDAETGSSDGGDGSRNAISRRHGVSSSMTYAI